VVERVVVTVKPNSRKGPLVEVAVDGNLTVFVREPAVDGKATAAVIRQLAEHFGVAKSRITLVHRVPNVLMSIASGPFGGSCGQQ
jgi:uncharacterized protein YggU (UPF0235/DUF167 family)